MNEKFKKIIPFFTTTPLITLTDQDINDMIGWAWEIIDNLKALWITIIGILIGITVLVVVLRAIRGKEN